LLVDAGNLCGPGLCLTGIRIVTPAGVAGKGTTMNTSHLVRRIATFTAAGAAVAAGVCAGTGAASADVRQDQQFLQELHADDITVSSPQTAINDAQIACEKLSSDASVTMVLGQLHYAYPGLTSHGVEQFLGAAVDAYCPGQLQHLH
jgi:hypothetical protein